MRCVKLGPQAKATYPKQRGQATKNLSYRIEQDLKEVFILQDSFLPGF